MRSSPLPRGLDAPKVEAKSNRCGGHLRAGALLEKLPWQVPAITRVTLIGPPIASLILLAVDYFEYWRAISFDFADFLAAYLVFAIPVGYVFGSVPMLLAASLYCALLTANSRLLPWRPLTRAGVAALCGGLASGVWFWVLLRTAWGIYALVGALVMAALSYGTPQPAQMFEQVRGDRRNSSTRSFARVGQSDEMNGSHRRRRLVKFGSERRTSL